VRVDVVSIFPDYLAPLALSLPGKAQQSGLLDLRVHDLRDWATDRHRTVDDSPYGGGAGMVMRPEPWGAALDELVPDAADGTVLLVPTPAGRPFTQALAAELARAERLVFACGRYEGIDQRVLDHAATRVRVLELSLGDYVLNGGEVAALAVTEAVVRLLPGFLGNPASLAEESHGSTGLLEYPVFTKPATWRGLDVPDVLLSGDHARIAAWRHEQSLRRTAARRPDLLPVGAALDVEGLADAEARTATPADAAELLVLQLACWVGEARANATLDIPPLHEDLDDVRAWLGEWTTLVVRSGHRLVAAVRMRPGGEDGTDWEIGRLMVAPDLQGRGLGRWLLQRAEAAAPRTTRRMSLVTGAGSARNLRTYRRAGYRPDRDQADDAGVVRLSKPVRPSR
jgi:tRNA (guanine37-N1)-methyltransferase